MEMARIRNWWSHSKTLTLIWFISISLFYSLFHMALLNSPHNYPPFSDYHIANAEQRARLYDKMARDLDEHGAVFLKHGETSQSLSLSDIFNLKDGVVTPVLKVANPPVRANVLYMSTEYSVPISEAVKRIFSPHFERAIWFQNSSLYHFSMFHASHHISPVPATEDEIEAEATAVRSVAEGLCPLKIVLDRVVLTSTGVLLGCWQVISGADPITIRAKLRTALPRAPEKQLYDAAILHTSFARLLGHPTTSSMEQHNSSDQLQFFHELVARLNSEIHGFEAVNSFEIDMGSEDLSPSVDEVDVPTDASIDSHIDRPCPTKKNKGKVPKRIHKAEREKLKREHLNELFLDLANALELTQQNSGKASVLCEATRLLKDLLGRIDSLRKENASLLSESHYVTVEKNELKEETSALESQIEKLQSELEARVAHSKPDLNVPPAEFQQSELASHFPGDSCGLPALEPTLQQASAVLVVPIRPNFQAYSTPDSAQLTSIPASNISKPHARYPTSADSWPSQLLGESICSSGNNAPSNI